MFLTNCPDGVHIPINIQDILGIIRNIGCWIKYINNYSWKAYWIKYFESNFFMVNLINSLYLWILQYVGSHILGRV